MKRFTIWGTSFAKLGDEAQIVSVCQVLESVYGSIDVVLLDQDRVRTRRAIPRLRTIRLRNLWQSIPRIMRSDALIVIGAPFFESAKQAIQCLIVLAAAKCLRKPVLCYGITVFDYGTVWGEKLYAFLLNNVEMLAIRERIGTEIAERIGVTNERHLITDPRCVLEPSAEAGVANLLKDAGVQPDQPLIGITTRYMDEAIPDWVKRNQGFSADANQRANAIIGNLVGDLAAYAQILVIPMHKSSEEDAVMVEIIRRHSSAPNAIKVLNRDVTAQQCLAVMMQCDMIISSRLVSSVFGAALGIPTFSIAYDARILDFAHSVDAHAHAVEWSSMDRDLASVMIQELWDNRVTVREQRQQVAVNLRQSVWQEAHLLDIDNNFEAPPQETQSFQG